MTLLKTVKGSSSTSSEGVQGSYQVDCLHAADGKSTGTRQIWLPNVCSQEHDANKTKIWDLKDMDADHVQAWKNSFDLVHCYKKVGHSRN